MSEKSTIGNRNSLSRNLKQYVSKSGKDRRVIANELGISYSTLTDWINGNKYPRINNIELLATYFNVSKAELIEDLKKDNDRLTTVVIKLRTNDQLFEVAEKLISLDKAKLESLSRFLDTFI